MNDLHTANRESLHNSTHAPCNSGKRPFVLALASRAAFALLAIAASACVAPGATGPAAGGRSPGSATGAAPSGWNDKPVNGSPGVNPPPLSGHNLILKENFKDGKSLPWTTSFSVPADGDAVVENGELCMKINNPGVNRWDAQLRHRDMVIQKGHTYSIQFTMHSTQKTRGYTKIGNAGPPYKEYWTVQLDLEPGRQIFKGVFTMQFDDDPSPELAFHLGGNMAKGTTGPFSVCIDDIHIDDPQFTPKAAAQVIPMANVLVNQAGYFPRLAKIATVKNPNAAKWELKNSGNATVATGTTTPVGADAASGDQVSIIDFSSFNKEGTGYTLSVGADVSHPFDIGDDVYAKIKTQALAYFYHNRSGIEIKMPFAGEQQWARPAGHVDVAPNKGDKKVPCAPGSGCDYTLDVTGGWYDAGDHGKYVVNLGISIWTLLNQWERAKHMGAPHATADFGDGKLNVPEKGNGVPDLLDEVRWGLEFALKMQVPDGQKLAGMVHHKIHDTKWTALGLAPHEDPIDRVLLAPSTAATLNMAANAAQAARVWRGIDKVFADKCLVAAEKAWTAAQANPAIFAKPGGVGGGPYDDENVSDEFYWAAAELFLTTKKPVYKDFVTKSPHYKLVPVNATASGADAGQATSMTWGNVQSLGSISLAVAPGLGADAEAIKKNIAATANAYLDIAKKQGYRVPFNPGPKGYPWGSNSFVMNNLIVIALAGDVTRDAKYLNGVAEGMDYIMGRNPMDQSYVSGYGERPLQWPHHRFWAYQANNKFPKVPPGVVSGGPNSGLEDPYVQAAGLKGCAPQKCFIDNIEAWSANEITINWNAPLAWLAAYLDERGGGKGGGHGGGKGEGKGEGGGKVIKKGKGK